MRWPRGGGNMFLQIVLFHNGDAVFVRCRICGFGGGGLEGGDVIDFLMGKIVWCCSCSMGGYVDDWILFADKELKGSWVWVCCLIMCECLVLFKVCQQV
jgi:hypothetical protein